MATSVLTPGFAGVDIDNVSTTQQFALGTVIQTTAGAYYKYVQADGAKTQYFVYAIDHAGQLGAGVTQTTDDTAPLLLGIPQQATSFADNEYGWVFVGPGAARVRVLASCAIDVLIYTTATAGALDDASASAKVVQGLKITTVNGGSAADQPCWAATQVHIST